MNELKFYLVLKHSNIMKNLSLKQIANLSQSDEQKAWHATRERTMKNNNISNKFQSPRIKC